MGQTASGLQLGGSQTSDETCDLGRHRSALLDSLESRQVAAVGSPSPCFSSDLIGTSLVLSRDRRTISHKDTKALLLNGVAVVAEPLKRLPAREAYFEVRVEESRTDIEDGMAIGVLASLPSVAQPLPAVADQLPDSWTFGYDGHASSPAIKDVPMDWKPEVLERGDCIGLLVNSNGEVSILHNGKPVAKAPSVIPGDVQDLFAIVDLCGRTCSVSLKLDAMPPLSLLSEPSSVAVPPLQPSSSSSSSVQEAIASASSNKKKSRCGALALQNQADFERRRQDEQEAAERCKQEKLARQEYEATYSHVIAAQDLEFQRSLLEDEFKDLLRQRDLLSDHLGAQRVKIEEAESRRQHAETRLVRYGENPRTRAEADAAQSVEAAAKAPIQEIEGQLKELESRICEKQELLDAVVIAAALD